MNVVEILDRIIDSSPGYNAEIHISKKLYMELNKYVFDLEKNEALKSKKIVLPNFGKIDSYKGFKLIVH